jgi:hypothetical protein
MELDIVMLNAPMISNLSVERPIAKIGKVIEGIMVAAVLSSMFGRRINMQMLTLPIHAQFQVTIVVRESNVEMELKDKLETVIKMVAISILSEMEIKISMDLVLVFQLILLVPSR